jgi:hypothetical protein
MTDKTQSAAADVISVRFTEARTVKDQFVGTSNETKFEKGVIYDLPRASAERWLRRRACEVVNIDDDGNEVTADVPKHIGGGWYLMPNGEKVKGKEAAGLA